MCEKSIIAMYPEDAPFPVYCQSCYWSDKWDAKSYGREYDPTRPFFDQWRELQLAVPLPSLMTEYTTMIGSDYCNGAGTLKNCYLCFGFDGGFMMTIIFQVDPEVEHEVDPKVETEVDPKVETEVDPKVETEVDPKIVLMEVSWFVQLVFQSIKCRNTSV